MITDTGSSLICRSLVGGVEVGVMVKILNVDQITSLIMSLIFN